MLFLLEGKKAAGALLSSFALFLCLSFWTASARGGDPKEKPQRKEGAFRILEVEKLFGSIKFALPQETLPDLELVEGGKQGAVFSPLKIDFQRGEIIFEAFPFFSRTPPGREFTIVCGKQERLSWRLPLEPGVKGFAVGVGRRRVRKCTLNLPAGKEVSLWGGAFARPDPISRRGPTSADPLPRGVSSGQALSDFIATKVLKEGEVLLAWCKPNVDGWGEIFVTTTDGLPARIASNGRFPQISASEEGLYCLWETREGIFLSRSSDNGKSWQSRNLLKGLRSFSGVRMASAFNKVLIVWQSADGICWLLSEDAGRSFPYYGRRKGPYSKPCPLLTKEGEVYVGYLRKSFERREVILERVSREKAFGEKVLVSGPDICDFSLWESSEGIACGLILSVGGEKRLAYRMPQGSTYLLPPTGGEPFAVDGGTQGEKIYLTYLQEKKGIPEVYLYTSRDSGWTWEGPLRVVSGRELCAWKAEAVLSWRGGGGGFVHVNGKKVISIPEKVETGRAVLGIPLDLVHPQGWISDKVLFTGKGSVDLSFVFWTLPYEVTAYGRSQVHAEALFRSLNKEESEVDLLLLAPFTEEESLSGRAGTFLNLPLGCRNLGEKTCRRAELICYMEGKEVARKRIESIEPGEEEYVGLQVPLPLVPGRYHARVVVGAVGRKKALRRSDSLEDEFPFDNFLTFRIVVLPVEALSLRQGQSVTFELSGQRRLRLKCTEKSFLLVQASKGDLSSIKAFLVKGEGSFVEVSLNGPIDFDPGTHVILLKNLGKKKKLTCLLQEKTDPFEPNDSPSLAKPIKPNVSLLCTFPSGDTDWFRVTVPEPGHLSFLREGKRGEIVVSVKKEAGRWIAQSKGLPYSLYVQRGSYLVAFREKWRRSVEEAQLIKVNLVSNHDPTEPNDFPEQCKLRRLPAGKELELKVLIEPYGDLDWFGWYVPEPGYLSILPEAGCPETFKLTLFDGRLQPLCLPFSEGFVKRVTEGKVFLLVESARPFQGKFKVFLAREFDPSEPNDRPSQAVKTLLPSEIDFHLWPQDDQDWFLLDCPENGILSLKLLEGESSLCGVSFWQEGRELSALKTLPSALRVQKGALYMEFEPLKELNGPLKFRVLAQFSTDPDPTEPNESPELARALDLSGENEVLLWPSGDIDFFQIETKKDGYITLEFKHVVKRPVEIALLSAGKNPKVCFAPEVSFRLPKGKNLLRIRSCSPLERPLSFRFKVKFLEEIDPGESIEEAGRSRSLSLRSFQEFAIFPGFDRDFFEFSLKRGAEYLLEADKAGGMDLRFDLFALNAPGRKQWRIEGINGKMLKEGLKVGEAFSLSPGRYLLVLYDASSKGFYGMLLFVLKPGS